MHSNDWKSGFNDQFCSSLWRDFRIKGQVQPHERFADAVTDWRSCYMYCHILTQYREICGPCVYFCGVVLNLFVGLEDFWHGKPYRNQDRTSWCWKKSPVSREK